MASLPKTEPVWTPMTAEELLAIRGTPQFEIECRKQAEALTDHHRKNSLNLAEEFFDWDVPGWTYDAEL